MRLPFMRRRRETAADEHVKLGIWIGFTLAGAGDDYERFLHQHPEFATKSRQQESNRPSLRVVGGSA